MQQAPPQQGGQQFSPQSYAPPPPPMQQAPGPASAPPTPSSSSNGSPPAPAAQDGLEVCGPLPAMACPAQPMGVSLILYTCLPRSRMGCMEPGCHTEAGLDSVARGLSLHVNPSEIRPAGPTGLPCASGCLREALIGIPCMCRDLTCLSFVDEGYKVHFGLES